MKIYIDDAGSRKQVEVQEGSTVLDALQAERIDIQAPCGGAGKCRRCQVLVRDEEGLNHKLACLTRVSEDMEVIIERTGAMEVLQSGATQEFPPDTGETGYGMSVDIGTTTVVAYLHDMATGERLAAVGRSNPQIAFGSDVISRISASIDGKLDLMTDIIQDAMREMKQKLCEQVGIEPDQVQRVCIAGNTVMQHIATRLAPDGIGAAPFTPLSLFGDDWEIEGLGTCYLTRCIAGYVGGDITAGMLARGIDKPGVHLFLDLGTNGEMALARDGKILSCATAAGPVFEGANVHFGMPASPGAISKVAFEGDQVTVQVIGNAKPVGLCGTGIIDAVATAVKAGIVNSRGRLLEAGELEEPYASWVGMEGEEPVFYLVPDKSVYITQTDVRNLQLAKGAVCGGIATLADEMEVSYSDIDTLEIAGGFGAFLDLDSAAVIGLFPEELRRCAVSVGNTSGEGASAMLISNAARAREMEIAQKCDYIELSNSAKFMNYYVSLMLF